MDSLIGVYAAVLTPFNSDYTCNIDELVEHCKDLIDKGCQGVVLFGTTGEGQSLSLEFRKHIINSLIEKNIPANKIIVSIGCCSIDDTVELARVSLKNKCNSVLMHPPYYFKNVSDEGVISLYREVIERVNNENFRIILYHIPQCTGVSISFYIIKELKRTHPATIIGIKDSAGNLEFTKSLIYTFPELKIFIGNDKQIAEAVRLGAAGSVSGVANVCPRLICSLYEHGRDSNKINKQNEMNVIDKLINSHNFISSLKAILASKRGAIWSLVMPPLCALTLQDAETLVNEYNSLNVD